MGSGASATLDSSSRLYSSQIECGRSIHLPAPGTELDGDINGTNEEEDHDADEEEADEALKVLVATYMRMTPRTTSRRGW